MFNVGHERTVKVHRGAVQVTQLEMHGRECAHIAQVSVVEERHAVEWDGRLMCEVRSRLEDSERADACKGAQERAENNVRTLFEHLHEIAQRLEYGHSRVYERTNVVLREVARNVVLKYMKNKSLFFLWCLFFFWCRSKTDDTELVSVFDRR